MFVVRLVGLWTQISAIWLDDEQKQVTLSNEGQSHVGFYMQKPESCTVPVYDWMPMPRVQEWCYMLTYMGMGH